MKEKSAESAVKSEKRLAIQPEAWHYKIAIVSGESNNAIEILAEKFSIEEIHQGIRKKIDIINSIIAKYSLSENEYLYIGDDVNDYDSLVQAKYAITVPNAIEKVKNIPHIQLTQADAGNGAFREIVDTLINDID